MTMHTENEAKQLWCPMVRYTHLTKAHGKPSINRWISEDDVELSPGPAKCIASGCAMWRWDSNRDYELVKAGHEPSCDPRRRGFCGLAGRPE